MDGLLMCGGEGTRLNHGEKPLFAVDGVPMVDRVLAALRESRVETIHAVTAPNAPETAAHLSGRVPRIEASGDGYVADLGTALRRFEAPVLTVVSDLPLLDGEVVDGVLDAHETGSVTVCVPTALKAALGVSVDATRAHGGRDLAPAGINVVGGDVEADNGVDTGRDDCADDGTDDGGGADETLQVSYDARLAVNVNRPADADVAEVLADGP